MRVYPIAMALAAMSCTARPVAAQGSNGGGAWFPGTRQFAAPIADPREPRTTAGLIGTNLFDGDSPERPALKFRDPDDATLDVQGTVGFAANLPVWGGGTAISVGIQAGVLGRFRIEKPSRDKVSSDWMVAVPVELGGHLTSARVRLLHRSSHLGDELMQATGARRIEYSHEAVDALVAYPVGRGARVYGGGAFIFRSNTEAETRLRVLGRRDRGVLQAGIDGEWPLAAAGRIALLAGLDWQRAQRTAWSDEVSLVAGLGGRTADHAFRLLLRFFDGPSPVGEFFLTQERFFGIEFVAEI